MAIFDSHGAMVFPTQHCGTSPTATLQCLRCLMAVPLPNPLRADAQLQRPCYRPVAVPAVASLPGSPWNTKQLSNTEETPNSPKWIQRLKITFGRIGWNKLFHAVSCCFKCFKKTLTISRCIIMMSPEAEWTSERPAELLPLQHRASPRAPCTENHRITSWWHGYESNLKTWESTNMLVYFKYFYMYWPSIFRGTQILTQNHIVMTCDDNWIQLVWFVKSCHHDHFRIFQCQQRSNAQIFSSSAMSHWSRRQRRATAASTSLVGNEANAVLWACRKIQPTTIEKSWARVNWSASV